MSITILTETELREAVVLDEAVLEAIEDGFRRLAQGQATMPPIMRVDVPEHNGEVDIKSAYLQGLEGFAVKISSGFFDNPQKGLPSLGGMMVLLSATVGFPLALLLDNGYLTDIRTAAAGAVAAKYLAPQKVETVGIIGAGTQARYQLEALKLVRDFNTVLVYGRNATRVAAFAEEMSDKLQVAVQPQESAAAVVQGSEVVVTTTPAKSPVVEAAWLHPGLHITAMGSDAEEKQELEAAILTHADVVVCDRKSQAFRLGELHHALTAGLITEDAPISELGEVIRTGNPARQTDSQITVCDLTGTGIQDTAIALLAYQRAQQAGLGTEIEG